MTAAPAPDDGALLDEAVALASPHELDTLPNPPVGCVLVAPDGRVVGRGAHRAYGLPHAEIDALAQAGDAARGGTAYVTLEPCGARGPGKKTPPCVEALQGAGIARVVFGARDPGSPHADGAGPRTLIEAGIPAEFVEHAGSAALLKRYARARTMDIPWVIAKWAMTLDGKTADWRGGSRWITGEGARRRVHEMRSRSDAVVIGSRTAALDDPDLRARNVPKTAVRLALRVVVDSSLRLSSAARVVATAGEAPVLIATGGRVREERRQALVAAGVEVKDYPGSLGRVDLRALFVDLRERGVGRVLLEGGGRITAAALDESLVHQVAAFIAPTVLGGRQAPSPVGGEQGLRLAGDPLRVDASRTVVLDGDVLVEGFLPAR